MKNDFPEFKKIVVTYLMLLRETILGCDDEDTTNVKQIGKLSKDKDNN